VPGLLRELLQNPGVAGGVAHLALFTGMPLRAPVGQQLLRRGEHPPGRPRSPVQLFDASGTHGDNVRECGAVDPVAAVLRLVLEHEQGGVLGEQALSHREVHQLVAQLGVPVAVELGLKLLDPGLGTGAFDQRGGALEQLDAMSRQLRVGE